MRDQIPMSHIRSKDRLAMKKGRVGVRAVPWVAVGCAPRPRVAHTVLPS